MIGHGLKYVSLLQNVLQEKLVDKIPDIIKSTFGDPNVRQKYPL